MATRYFRNFDIVDYRFGDNEPSALFQNISTYVDIIDQLKAEVSFYEDYTIVTGDRPDTTSFKLYDTPEYYWTFYLLNDKLRESGWPLNREDVRKVAMERYPHRVVTTKDNISTKPFDFPVGRTVQGFQSGTVGTIIKRNLDLGQLIIDTTNTVIEIERDFEITPNTNGFADITLTNDRETFHSVSLWQITQDGSSLSNVEITLGRLKKTAELRNIPYKEGSEYIVTAFIKSSNPTDNNFGQDEAIFYVDQDTGVNIFFTAFKESPQYDAVHHYERKTYTAFNLDTLQTVFTSYDRREARLIAESLDNGELRTTTEWVDIDPYTQVVPAGATAVTYLERFEQKNDDLKQIKVLKPDVVEEVAENFYRKLRENI